MTQAMWTEITQQCFLLSRKGNNSEEGRARTRTDIISRIFDARAGKTRGGPTNIKTRLLRFGHGICPVQCPSPWRPFSPSLFAIHHSYSYSQKNSAEYAPRSLSPSSQKNFKKNIFHSWIFFSHGVGRSSLFLFPSSFQFPCQAVKTGRDCGRGYAVYDSRASYSSPLFIYFFSFSCHRFASK